MLKGCLRRHRGDLDGTLGNRGRRRRWSNPAGAGFGISLGWWPSVAHYRSVITASYSLAYCPTCGGETRHAHYRGSEEGTPGTFDVKFCTVCFLKVPRPRRGED